MSSRVHAGCSCGVFVERKLVLCWSTDKLVFKGLIVIMSSFKSYSTDLFVNYLKLHFNITRDKNIDFFWYISVFLLSYHSLIGDQDVGNANKHPHALNEYGSNCFLWREQAWVWTQGLRKPLTTRALKADQLQPSTGAWLPITSLTVSYIGEVKKQTDLCLFVYSIWNGELIESSKHPTGSLITAAQLWISLPVMAADKQNP